MININIDDFSYNIKNKLTVIQACFINKIDVPRFCFHEKLSIAGNCRMCLVEDENQIKPLASCAIDIRDNMSIQTNTLKVKKARESVLEFLLANHPLDCPICDQGGECDLQDQSMIFGSDRGRFYEHKRAVEDKDCGPLIKTIMNRCIHCTRCVRFGNEVAGTSFLGVTGRGSKMEIGSYIEKMISSEISGNVIDLCPVGALTSKPFAFTSRPWELKNFNSIDVLDGMHSNIRIDVRGTKIMRVLPRVNENINGEWITDKIRFSYDGFRRQRLYYPIVLHNKRYTKVSWQKMLFYMKAVFLNISRSSVFPAQNSYLNNLADLETVYSIKNFLNKMGSSTNSKRNMDNQSYFFNTRLSDIELTDTITIVNCNLRLMYPLLNAKIRQTVLNNSLPCYFIGFYSNFNFYAKHLSLNFNTLLNVLEANHWLSVKNVTLNSQKPLFLFGKNAEMAAFSNHLTSFTNVISDKWNGLNACFSLQNISELNMHNCSRSSNVNFLMNFDEKVKMNRSFNIYMGHHGDSNALKCDVILPTSSFVEKTSHYINIFSNVQKTSKALFSVGQSRKDWTVIAALKSTFGISKSAYTKQNLVQSIESCTPLMVYSFAYSVLCAELRNSFAFLESKSRINNYYLTDSISKNSKIMSLSSNVLKNKAYNFQNKDVI